MLIGVIGIIYESRPNVTVAAASIAIKAGNAVILRGGKDLVNKAQAVILEVSFIEYNEGAPTAEETIDYMDEIGFEERMSLGEHYDGEIIVQKDLLFINRRFR